MAEITRADMPITSHPDYLNTVITGMTEQSIVLSTFPTTRTNTKLTKIPVLLGKPEASFVSEDLSSSDSIKPTSEVTLDEVSATMETVAVIIPIKREVAMDMAEGAGIDPWNLVRPQVEEAFARKLDHAIVFGTGKPDTWDDGLVEQAVAAGQEVTASSPVAWTDFNDLIGDLEDLGYDAERILTYRGMRRHLRGMKDQNDRPIFLDNVRSDGNLSEILTAPTAFTKHWDDDASLALAIDPAYVRVFIREELNVTFSEHAAYTQGGSLRSAFERNVILARFEMRCGWCVAAPQGDLPFVSLAPAGS